MKYSDELIMKGNDIVIRLREFMENEARSCSMDFGCVTPEYVYRMWGGQFSMNEIETGLARIRNKIYSNMAADIRE